MIFAPKYLQPGINRRHLNKHEFDSCGVSPLESTT